MAIRTVILVLLTLLSAIFLIVNWAGITAAVPVNLIYTDTEAPLGLILLLVLGALWIAGIIWALLQQAATLLEIRRAYKDAESSRGLADNAEKSRFEAAKKLVHDEIVAAQEKFNETNTANAAKQAELQEKLAQRLEALEDAVKMIDTKLDAVLKDRGMEVVLEEPEEKKKGFFSFLSHKEKEAQPALHIVKAAAPAKEAEAKTEEKPAEAASEPAKA